MRRDTFTSPLSSNASYRLVECPVELAARHHAGQPLAAPAALQGRNSAGQLLPQEALASYGASAT